MNSLRIAEFQIKVVKYLGTIPVVVYEVTQPAEVYTQASKWNSPLKNLPNPEGIAIEF